MTFRERSAASDLYTVGVTPEALSKRVWANGIHYNVRSNKDRPRILVLVSTLPDGTKELVAVHEGQVTAYPPLWRPPIYRTR